MIRSLMILTLLIACGCSALPHSLAQEVALPKSCLQDEPRRKDRAEELVRIVKADQDDRSNWQSMTSTELAEMVRRDVIRRKRVGEIFGEGCFSTPQDYASAALVYQHGDTPDHYLQTFMWAKRAVELGDKQQKRLMALGIDRYLINTGKKQLFASQAQQDTGTKCWCLDPVERDFPSTLRREYMAWDISDALKWVGSMNEGKSCEAPTECKKDLMPSPRSTVPGFW